MNAFNTILNLKKLALRLRLLMKFSLNLLRKLVHLLREVLENTLLGFQALLAEAAQQAAAVLFNVENLFLHLLVERITLLLFSVEDLLESLELRVKYKHHTFSAMSRNFWFFCCCTSSMATSTDCR